MDLQRNTLNSEHLGNNGWVSRSKYSLIKTNYFTFLLFFLFSLPEKSSDFRGTEESHIYVVLCIEICIEHTLILKKYLI